ncbi:4459_t:CDS:2 [Paraglomus occultum]|uniref:4459_t:CDS:1 n=1 Tax=Paraglomus occultum TaxID=144539 RepID=A0A9N9BTW6_9GLOM|nr:4459_t:CDS:2 [Paraglomus occultum]
MSFQFYSNLSTDLSRLLDSADDYNVRMLIGVDGNARTFNAHSVILRARSAYFHAALSKDWAKTEEGSIIFKKENISPKIFQVILRYIYGGVLSCKLETGKEVLELLLAADEMQLEELIKPVQMHLLQEWEPWIRSNFIQLHRVSSANSAFKELFAYCSETLLDDPAILFKTGDYLTADEDTLISVLERNDLVLDEVDIWNHVIAWGKARMSETLVTDPNKWVDEDFQVLKSILKRCLPLVRVDTIRPEDFYNQVKPYKKILPRELYQAILKRQFIPSSPLSLNVLPPRTGIDSNLITWKHVDVIASWIDRKGRDQYYFKQNQYFFKLLLRGSVSGFTPKTFHELCDAKGPTVILIKPAHSNDLIGGYNPIGWRDDGGYQSTTDSFLFKLSDNNGTGKISRVRNKEHAVGWHSDCGPDFGMTDLCLHGHFRDESSCYCRPESYASAIFSNVETFSVEEYEVFQVKRKSTKCTSESGKSVMADGVMNGVAGGVTNGVASREPNRDTSRDSR